MVDKYYHPDTDFLRKYNVPLPTTASHGTQDDIQSNMQRLMPTSWRLDGNRLIGKTELGEVVNFVPSNLILTGTDDQGLPILRKIDI